MSSGQVLGVRKVFGGSGSGGAMDEEFEVSFVDHMWNSHGKCEVPSSVAFKSYCSNKNHIPISKTSWSGFGAFLQHLQQSGKCRLRKEPNQPGFWISMGEIGSAPTDCKRKADDERFLDEQIQRAAKTLKKHSSTRLTSKPGELLKSEKISFSLPAGISKKPKQLSPSVGLFQADVPVVQAAAEPHSNSSNSSSSTMLTPTPNPTPSSSSSPLSKASKKPHIQETIEQQEAEKIRELLSRPRSSKWVDAGLIVRVASKPISRGLQRFSREEAVVEDVHKDGLRARIRLLHLGKKLSVDQEDLRPVVPEKGELVRIVNGGFKGWDGMIVVKDVEKQTADIGFTSGEFQGKTIAGISLADMCLRDLEVIVAPWRLRHHR